MTKFSKFLINFIEKAAPTKLIRVIQEQGPSSHHHQSRPVPSSSTSHSYQNFIVRIIQEMSRQASPLPSQNHGPSQVPKSVYGPPPSQTPSNKYLPPLLASLQNYGPPSSGNFYSDICMEKSSSTPILDDLIGANRVLRFREFINLCFFY